VIYDDDDPWNQTAADNAEWLMRFKRDVGLLPNLSGLPSSESSWPAIGAETNFSPAYVIPSKEVQNFAYKADVDLTMMQDKVYKVYPEAAAKFIQDLKRGTYLGPSGTVFCSRDLEQGLSQVVESELANGRLPSDDWLRAKAREILGVEQTAADEVALLKKFKSLHGIGENDNISASASAHNLPLPGSGSGSGSGSGYSLPDFSDDAMLAEFDLELGTMDLSSDFSTAGLHPSLETLIDPMMQVDMHHTGTQSYADFHRVHAATASPLQRRASERLASNSGLERRNLGNMHVTPKTF